MGEKVTLMLAGAGHEAVYYQMQPSFLTDERFSVATHATQWSAFEPNLQQMQPDLVIVQAEIAPGPDVLLPVLSRLQAWNGVAIVILPIALKDMEGIYRAASAVVRGVYVAPVSWVEVAQAGYSAVVTERTRLTNTAPLQQALAASASMGGSSIYPSTVTGTKRIAVISHAGGAGCSTIAENLAYVLKVQNSVQTLLLSLGLPPAAVPHFKLKIAPTVQEYMERPGKASLQAALQSREGLEVLLSPDTSAAYLKADETSRRDAREPGSIYSMLLDCENGQYAAIIMDIPSHEDTWTIHPLVFANTVLIVARPTLADCAAVRHTLNLLLYGLREENRKPKESIFLVLNQVSERSGMTPRSIQETLLDAVGWAPPIAAIIPNDPAVTQAQDSFLIPVTRSDSFAKGIQSLIQVLFPNLGRSMGQMNTSNKSVLRLPRIRIGG